jgi:hypothetical protein
MNEDKPPSVSSWSKVLLSREVLTKQEFSRASLYRARYEFARDFRDLSSPETSSQTRESYFVLLKLGLAHSAVETLEGIFKKHRRVVIRDENFIMALQSGVFKKLISHLQERARKPGRDSSGDLEKYLNPSPREDLADLVRHSRNVVFHGSVSPTSIGLNASRKSRELILGLANSSLTACDAEFSKWAKEIKNRKKP